MRTARGRLDCLKPAACLVALMMLTEGTAAVTQCPSRLSCLLQRRHPCTPRTLDCGPCLAEYQDDLGGKCIERFRTHVSKADPKLIEFIYNLLRTPKAAKPSGLKSSRKEWKTPAEGPKTSPEGLKMISEGLKTPSEDLKTLLEGLNPPPEEMKNLSKGKTPPEGLKTSTYRPDVLVSKERSKADLKQSIEFIYNLLMAPKAARPSGLKSSRKEWKTLAEGPKTSPEGLKMPSEGLKTPSEDLKTLLKGLNPPPEEMKNLSKGKTPPEGLKTSSYRPNFLAGANTTDRLPPTWSSAAPPLPPPPNATMASVATQPPETTSPTSHDGPVKEPRKQDPANLNDAVSLTLVVICTITGVSGLLVAALCWYRLQKEVRLAQKMAYTAYRGSRQYPPSQRPGDARLAQSVQVHHYQHQKKKLQGLEESGLKAQQQLSTESEAENDGGEYTVYECPGLAPTGEMEIHNPLFFDSSVLHAGPGPPCQSLK